jgi:signal transduction histidine kinase
LITSLFRLIDWFVPAAARRERSDLGMARNYVFINLAGPILAQPAAIFLWLTDPHPGPVLWTIIAAIWSFPLAPFVFKAVGRLQPVALVSVEVLAALSLFGSFFYGGVSSPFLPWFVLSLLLFFFYLGDRPRLVLGLCAADLMAFAAARVLWGGFPDRVPLEQLALVDWISIASATVFMAWMAVYYVSTLALRSELETEAERHRRTAARLMRAKAEAERANAKRSIFLAKMSHEFRTPLNAVIGYSELLLELGQDSGANRQKLEDLRRINAAGRHLLGLVTDVLDLGRIEARTVELAIEAFPLEELIADVAATARPLVEAGGNRLVLEGPTAGAVVRTDKIKLRQVLLNLLGNSAKFTAEGAVTVTARIERQPGGDWLEVRVDDTGVGMSEAELSRLFQDFVQASPEIAGRYGGTGLGLAVSQRLCGLMGGGISVESAPGRGSSFIVRLPAHPPSEDAAAAA